MNFIITTRDIFTAFTIRLSHTLAHGLPSAEMDSFVSLDRVCRENWATSPATSWARSWLPQAFRRS